jgi:glycosyltransferase involved in cell wall biosynthesis
MRLLVLAPRNSRFSPRDFWGRGLGGNEATLLCWVARLRALGHRVEVIFGRSGSDPGRPALDRAVGYWSAPGRAQPDAVIGFRDARCLHPWLGRTVTAVFTGDRLTPGLWHGCSPHSRPDLVLAASPAARRQVLACASWANPVIVPLGHVIPPRPVVPVARRRGRFVHSSAPYRGLAHLLEAWPAIRQRVPDAELYICGGYRLWGYNPQTARALTSRDAPRILTGPPGVRYLGPLPRSEYLRLLRSAEAFLYPTDYYEMYCIAAVEAMAAGAVPIVSAVGALTDRVRHGIDGVLVRGSPRRARHRERFAAAVATAAADRHVLARLREEGMTRMQLETVDAAVRKLLTVLDAARGKGARERK